MIAQSIKINKDSCTKLQILGKFGSKIGLLSVERHYVAGLKIYAKK